MGGLIINEFQKILRNKKYMIIVIMFAALLTAFSFLIYKSMVNQTPENIIAANQSYIDVLNTEKHKKGITEERKKDIEQRIANMTKEIENQKEIQALRKGDWKEEYRKQIKKLEEQKEKANGALDNNSLEKINSQIKERKYALDNNTKPTGDKPDAYRILIMSLMLIGMLFLAAGVSAFSADIVSKEYTYPTIKVLLTKPVSRAKVIFSKYIVSILSSLFLIIFVEMLVFGAIGFIVGFGNPSEPVSIGTKYIYDTLSPKPGGYSLMAVLGSTAVVPLWQLFVEMLAIECIYVIACVSFSFLLSTLTRNNMAAVTAGIISTVALNIFIMFLMQNGGSGSEVINNIVPFLFTTYGNIPMLLGVEQSLSIGLGNPLITPAFGVGVCLAWALICYVASHIVFVKRDNLA